MSRSRKNTPIISIAYVGRGSTRWFKQYQHRRIRRRLKNMDMSDGNAFRKLVNYWDDPRDGKQWFPEGDNVLRK